MIFTGIILASIWSSFYREVDRYALGFVIGKLVQQDLDGFVLDWNNHPIRKNLLMQSPHGRPNDMYDMPALYGV